MHQPASGLVNPWGCRERLYCNTLLYLAPNTKPITKLRNAFGEHEALNTIHKDYGTLLDEEQKEDLKKRKETAWKSVQADLGPTYSVILKLSGQSVEEIVLKDARPKLSDHLNFVCPPWSKMRRGSCAGLVPSR